MDRNHFEKSKKRNVEPSDVIYCNTVTEVEKVGLETEKTNVLTKHKKNKAIVLFTIIVIIFFIAFIAFFSFSSLQVINLPVMSENGNVAIYSDQEISSIKEKIKNSTIAVGINSPIIFKTSSDYGEFNFDNFAFNNANMYMEIYLENQSKPVYTTKMLLPPNSHISEDTLDVVVPKGSYDATVVLKAVDSFGNVTANGYIPIKIKVLEN